MTYIGVDRVVDCTVTGPNIMTHVESPVDQRIQSRQNWKHASADAVGWWRGAVLCHYLAARPSRRV